MINNRPLIVLAQTDHEILELIRTLRDRRAPIGNCVLLTSSPAEVLYLVKAEAVDIVVTGHLFYKLNVRAQNHSELYLPVPGPRTSTALSEAVYQINPCLLTFRCSAIEHLIPNSDRGKVVGMIEKVPPFQDLLGFIDAPELASILENMDWPALEGAFPNIVFFRDWRAQLPANTK